MPRQNTRPADFPPNILGQIEKLAQSIVAQRKSRGETQMQWAERLGVSQPTMARLERGDPSVAMATYISYVWQLNPALDLCQWLADAPAQSTTARASSSTTTVATTAPTTPTAPAADSRRPPKPPAEPPQEISPTPEQVLRNFAAAKAALDFFKSPLL